MLLIDMFLIKKNLVCLQIKMSLPDLHRNWCRMKARCYMTRHLRERALAIGIPYERELLHLRIIESWGNRNENHSDNDRRLLEPSAYALLVVPLTLLVATSVTE